MLKFLYLFLLLRLHIVVIPTLLCPFLSPELLIGILSIVPPAIPTCSNIIFLKGTFLDSLTAESVSGSTWFCRSTACRNTSVEGITSTSSALPSDFRVSSRINDPNGHVDSDVLNSSRIPVADHSSVGPLGFVENDVPTDSSFPTDRPSVSTPALSRGSSQGLTATALRVNSPSHSTPDCLNIRTLRGYGSLARGGGQASSTGQSGSTLSGHGHVHAISQIPRVTSRICEYDPYQALWEVSPSLEENQSHEPAINYHETGGSLLPFGRSLPPGWPNSRQHTCSISAWVNTGSASFLQVDTSPIFNC